MHHKALGRNAPKCFIYNNPNHVPFHQQKNDKSKSSVIFPCRFCWQISPLHAPFSVTSMIFLKKSTAKEIQSKLIDTFVI